MTVTRFSVVTISFNQAQFLRTAVDSVLSQQTPEVGLEYIVCDPGSTDDSRAIIDSYEERIAHRVYERDDGPADGLNKGFAHASGDIFCYLNSDDYFLPGAFAAVARYFAAHPAIDVVMGHALVVNEAGDTLRRVWSEPYERNPVAYGAHVQIQPSTFIRAEAFCRSGGFDPADRSNWDGDLLVSLFLAGARLAVLNEFLSAYRLHDSSITTSGRMHDAHVRSAEQRFSRLMGRPMRPADRWIARAWRLAKHLRWPGHALERYLRGPLFDRSKWRT